MSNDLQTARLVALTMKRYDAHIEVLGTKGDAIKNSIARSRLKVAENNLNQACETVKKKGAPT
ncbi:hypothetical protein ACO0LB_10130 [Undibacterium sp. SXout7W]|uniref:hypothetical protein n=1 Tax=Undibacterium sp. SXout7W TaxID=3413049 RepID=UPI003BF026F1